MEAKFTPGPWQDSPSGVIYAKDGRELAKTNYLKVNSGESWRSNSVLIKASPEMYAALERILVRCDGLEEPNGCSERGYAELVDDICQCRNIAIEALKKARGEA